MIRSNLILTRYKKTLLVTSPIGDWIDGKWVETYPTPVKTRGHVQPLRNEDVQFLPEGARRDEYRNYITGDKLNAVDEKADPQIVGDLVQFIDFMWRVVYKKEHDEGNRHNAYIMKKFRPLVEGDNP